MSNVINVSTSLRHKVEVVIAELVRIFEDNNKILLLYSGGKDSTLVLHLVLEAYLALNPTDTHIFVASVNTLVDIPAISKLVENFINNLNQWARENALNIKGVILTPKVEDRFWSLLLGKGYPMPNFHFRWCVDRLKIKPVANFINKIEPEVILLGSRLQESSARSRNLRARLIGGKWQKYRTRGMNKKIFIKAFLPILDWTTDEVWEYLLEAKTPWQDGYKELVQLYIKFDTCKLFDPFAPKCDGSRFGCWTCSVVKRDRALEALAKDGDIQASKFLNLKEFLIDFTRDINNRVIDKNGKPRKLKLEKRKFLFRKLQEEFRCIEHLGANSSPLISNEEIEYIQKIWREEL